MLVPGLTAIEGFFCAFRCQSSRASDVVAEAGPRREKPDEGDVEHTAEFKNILKEVEELGLCKSSLHCFLEVLFDVAWLMVSLGFTLDWN